MLLASVITTYIVLSSNNTGSSNSNSVHTLAFKFSVVASIVCLATSVPFGNPPVVSSIYISNVPPVERDLETFKDTLVHQYFSVVRTCCPNKKIEVLLIGVLAPPVS